MKVELNEESLNKAKQQLYKLGLYDAYESLENAIKAELSKNYKDIESCIVPKEYVNKYYCAVWLNKDLKYNEHGKPIKAIYGILGYQAYKVKPSKPYSHHTYLLVNTFIDYIAPDIEKIKEL